MRVVYGAYLVSTSSDFCLTFAAVVLKYNIGVL